MTQAEITWILKEKGYMYLAGEALEVWQSESGAIHCVEVYYNGEMNFYISNDDGEPMDSFNIEKPTPELLKQIL